MELCIRSDFPFHHLFDHIQKILFQILAEKFGRDLDRKGRVLHSNWLDWSEPSVELLRFYDLLKYFETVVPYHYVLILNHP